MVLKDGKFLIVRGAAQDYWKNVGGKLEDGETPEQCLAREIKEELGVGLSDKPKHYFSLPTTKAVSDPSVELDIHLYLCGLSGEPVASSEIEELRWMSKDDFEKRKYNVTYQMADFIIPKLVKDGLLTK